MVEQQGLVGGGGSPGKGVWGREGKAMGGGKSELNKNSICGWALSVNPAMHALTLHR